MSRSLIWFRAIILSFILGIIFFGNKFDQYKPKDYWIGKNITAEGVIVKNPLEIEDKKYLAIRLKDEKLKDLLLAPVNFYEEFNKGDKVLVSGVLQENTYNPFDIFLNSKLTYIVNQVNVKVIQASSYKDYFFILRNLLITKIKQIFLPRESFLAIMILVGKGGGYNREINEMFKQAGLSHILVVSGMHITMFIDILNYLVYLFPVSLLFLFGANIVFIIFFILLVGFSGSMFRAAIMGVLQVISKLNHRMYNMTNSLLLSALIILIFNPATLLVDLGFQLSFLSVLCLVYICPMFCNILTERIFRERWKSMVVALAVVLSIYVGMTPFLIYKMNSISFVSPIANLVVVPLVAPLLSLVIMALFLNILWGRIFWVFNILVSWYLKFVLFVVGIFSSMKYANYPISGLSLIILFLYYFFLIVYLVRYYIKHRQLTLSF